MVENSSVALLKGLGDAQFKELLENITLITDRLGQELIQMAASLNSPIDAKELPILKNGLRDQALYRLYQLEKLGVFTSSLEFKNGITNRIFTITDLGRNALFVG